MSVCLLPRRLRLCAVAHIETPHYAFTLNQFEGHRHLWER